MATPEQKAERIFKEDELIQKERTEKEQKHYDDVKIKLTKIVKSRMKPMNKIEKIRELHQSYGYGEMRMKEIIPLFQELYGDCLIEALLQWFI